MKDTPTDENPYWYAEQLPNSRLSKFAIEMTEPKMCFGEDFITFEQLTSPEWQLCQTDDPVSGNQVTYMCVTDNPSEILMRLEINDV